MRIWDLDPSLLCNKHLMGEHYELHGIWTMLCSPGKGVAYRHHPEYRRWIGKMGALWLRHQRIAQVMIQRGFQHNSDLLYCEEVADCYYQNTMLHSIKEQIELLWEKNCDCKYSLKERRKDYAIV